MLERLLILLALAGVVLAGVQVARAVARRRTAAAIGELVPEDLRSRLPSGRAAMVYFYGPNCATCADQAHVLGNLAEEQRVAIVPVDATVERYLAGALGALTVPSTALLDGSGRVRHVNVGYHPKAILARQLAGL
ncbi:MAG: thioredoxin family protein [Chloroflexi bacterium]|nr:thioredoxin family protein [Chloroflexota bacterium]